MHMQHKCTATISCGCVVHNGGDLHLGVMVRTQIFLDISSICLMYAVFTRRLQGSSKATYLAYSQQIYQRDGNKDESIRNQCGVLSSLPWWQLLTTIQFCCLYTCVSMLFFYVVVYIMHSVLAEHLAKAALC